MATLSGRVDLTENQEYGRLGDGVKTSFYEELRALQISISRVWKDIDEEEKEIVANPFKFDSGVPFVPIGDVEKIRWQKEFEQVYQGNMCECCGEPISNIPWDFYGKSTLCKKCSDRLFNDSGKPWEKKSYNISKDSTWWKDI